MPKPYVQVGARLDLETAAKLEELNRTYGTTVRTLTVAIHRLYTASDADADTAAVPKTPKPRTGKPAPNARYGQTAQELETLARILELYKAGHRKGEIVDTLNAEQRKPRTGNAWTIQRLSTILKTAKGGNE
jgi:hypothetical protein